MDTWSYKRSDTFDHRAFRDDSRQLWEFQNGDHSSMADEIADVLGETDPPPRYANVARRACEDRAAQYVYAPRRTFGRLGASGQFVAYPAAFQAAWARVYQLLDMDRVLKRASRIAYGQQSLILTVVPEDSAPGGAGLRVEYYAPWQCEVELKSDPGQADPAMADAVKFLVPVRRDGDTITYGERVLTATEAYVQPWTAGGREAVYPAGIAHGLGVLPVVGVRLADAVQPGVWFAAINQSLLAAQVGVNLCLSDNEEVTRLHAPPETYFAGENAYGLASTVARVPGGGTAIPDNVQITRLATTPPVDAYSRLIEGMVKMVASTERISWRGLLDVTGITADAREVERQDQKEAREEEEALWLQVEQRLARLVARVWNAVQPDRLDPDVVVRVDWRYPEPRQNDLQQEQARQLRMFRGLTSPARELAREEGIPLAEARERIKENLEEVVGVMLSLREQLGTIPTDGLDSIADSAMGEEGPPS